MALKKRKTAHKPVFHHVPFWSTVALLLILGGVTLFNFNSETSLTGGVVIQTIGYMQAGEELFFEVKQGGIQDATITFTSDVKNGKIFFEEDPLIYFRGAFISKMEVRMENVEFSCMDITLKVLEKDLNQNGINREEVALFVNGVQQETVLKDIEAEHNYYSISCVKELGQFVIGKETAVVTVVTEELEVTPEVPVEEPVPREEVAPRAIAGKAVELPPEMQQPAESGFWQRVKTFFRHLFG